MATIVATFTDAQGDPAVGYVQFVPRQIREALRADAAVDGIVTTTKIRVPLDGFGAMVADLEPGDYNVAIVLQYARTIFTTATIPFGDATLELRSLLGAYLPTQRQAGAVYGSPGDIEWAIPYSATKIDYALLGAGGGGDAGTFITVGPGGLCGAWKTGTLVRGTDVPLTTQALTGKVGAGVVGANGEATTLSGAGLAATLSAAGGVHGANKGTFLGVPNQPISYGQGVTPTSLNEHDFTGGAVQTTWGADGNGPGGGGSGGFQTGSRGGDGRIWLYAY